MAHVGIKRFGARESQHDGTQRDEHVPALRLQEVQRCQRVECREDGRLLHDLQHPGERQHTEPEQDDRAEQAPHEPGAIALHGEQRDQHAECGRQHVGLQHGGDHLQPLHRTQHRDGRRDHTVAVEQRGAHHACQQQGDPPASRLARSMGSQRGQRHDAALTPVVGPEDEQHVLERDHQHQPPDDGRDGTDEVRRIQRHAGGRAENFFHGVQRAGADVAVHHTQRAQGQGGQAFALGNMVHECECAVVEITTVAPQASGTHKGGAGAGGYSVASR